MTAVEPEGGGVEALAVGLASAADTAEVADEFEGGKGVEGPGKFESLEDSLWWGVGDHVEEEVQTWISRCEECGRHVFC